MLMAAGLTKTAVIMIGRVAPATIVIADHHRVLDKRRLCSATLFGPVPMTSEHSQTARQRARLGPRQSVPAMLVMDGILTGTGMVLAANRPVLHERSLRVDKF